MSDPITVTIAAAIVTGAVSKITESASEATVTAFKSLSKAVFRHFRGVPEAQDALDEARIDPDDQKALTTVAEHLEKAGEADAEIGRLLGDLRSEVTMEGDGAVYNSIQGNVSDNAKVVQTRDIHGSVNL